VSRRGPRWRRPSLDRHQPRLNNTQTEYVSGDHAEIAADDCCSVRSARERPTARSTPRRWREGAPDAAAPQERGPCDQQCQDRKQQPPSTSGSLPRSTQQADSETRRFRIVRPCRLGATAETSQAKGRQAADGYKDKEREGDALHDPAHHSYPPLQKARGRSEACGGAGPGGGCVLASCGPWSFMIKHDLEVRANSELDPSAEGAVPSMYFSVLSPFAPLLDEVEVEQEVDAARPTTTTLKPADRLGE